MLSSPAIAEKPARAVPQRESRPPGQVALACRPVAHEVAASELGERSFAVDLRLLAEPVADEHERLLFPDHRSAHDEPAQRREQQHVHECLAFRADPC
jgi:hypothetical protein